MDVAIILLCWDLPFLRHIGSYSAGVVKDKAPFRLRMNFQWEYLHWEMLELKMSVYMASSYEDIEKHLFFICISLLYGAVFSSPAGAPHVLPLIPLHAGHSN